MKYKIWDQKETLVTPVGEVLTAQEVFEKYPASQLPSFKFIIADAPISMAVFMEFESTKSQYKNLGAEITDGMSDEEVLAAITAFEEKPAEAAATAEERIASALEFQVMMTLPEGDM